MTQVKGLEGLEEGTLPWYRKAYAVMTFDEGYSDEIARAAKRVQSGMEIYLRAERRTGVPWWVFGGLHWKECSCDFKGVLHNGERIVGTGRKTTIVPKGRGPFATWDESAYDAIMMNASRWAKIKAGAKDIGEILYAVERYNGAGYLNGAGRAETSPYLWAMTSINDDHGKYVADGKFDPSAPTNKTAGFAAIAKYLEQSGVIEISKA